MKKLILIAILLFIINRGSSQCSVSLFFADPACAGICNGSAAMNTVSGTAPFSFSWSTGDTTIWIDNLCPGTYSLTITDSLGCVYTDSVTLVDPPPDTTFIVDVFYIAGTSGVGWCDGEINLTVQGGTPSYTYHWKNCVTNQDIWPNPYFCPGEYYCIAEDDNGCLDTTDCITVSDPVVGLQLSAHDNFEVFPNPVKNELYVTVIGTIPQKYKIYSLTGQLIGSGSVKENKIDFSDLKPGQYILKVILEECIYSSFVVKE
ncbi:MAG: T9SS type A sorting domain-containing protein [Crocinitomicaceae bacterium]